MQGSLLKICQVGTHCWPVPLDVHHVTVWLWGSSPAKIHPLSNGNPAPLLFGCQVFGCQVFAIFFKKIYRRRKRIVLMVTYLITHHQRWYPFHHITVSFLLLNCHRFKLLISPTPSISSISVRNWRYGRNRSGGRKHQGATNRKLWYFSLYNEGPPH